VSIKADNLTRPTTMMKTLRPTVLLVLTTTLCACPRREDDDDEAPALPPADTMTFFELKEGARSTETSGQALTLQQAAGDTSNVKLAIGAVGLVTTGVNLALLWPRTFIAGVISTRPTHDGEAWVWKRTFPLLGWDANLRGKVDGGRLATEMRVTGLKPDNSNHQNFLWYTGDHGTRDGKWTVFAFGQPSPVLTIDWARAAADDKQLTFTNVTTGQDGSGDRLGYSIKTKIATMAIHDARDASGQPADSSVVWHVENGSGKITAPAAMLCWETLAKGQVNMPCPAGDWPVP
jgi:hypothetical protein